MNCLALIFLAIVNFDDKIKPDMHNTDFTNFKIIGLQEHSSIADKNLWYANDYRYFLMQSSFQNILSTWKAIFSLSLHSGFSLFLSSALIPYPSIRIPNQHIQNEYKSLPGHHQRGKRHDLCQIPVTR